MGRRNLTSKAVLVVPLGIAILANALASTAAAQSGTPNKVFPAAQYYAGYSPRGIAAANFTGDGMLDLMVANNTLSTASVLKGDGTGVFTMSGVYSTAAGSHGLVAADLNGDGSADAIVANSATSHISVLTNNAYAGFTSQLVLTVYLPWKLALGDVNNDGKLDVAVSGSNSLNLAVHLNNGTGGFGSPILVPMGGSTAGVALGDIDLNGTLDLAATKFSSNTIITFLGNGAGGFGSSTSVSAGTSPQDITFASFNSDNAIDLACANSGSNDVTILLNTRSGAFTNAGNHLVGSAPTWVRAADLDGDGRMDLCVSNYDSNDVSRLLGNGIGGFGNAKSFGVGSHPSGIALVDFNGDGVVDLAADNTGPSVGSGPGSHCTSILFGAGNGDFVASTNYAVGTNPNSLATGDFNCDGAPDVAVANAYSSSVSVHFGDGAGHYSASQTLATTQNAFQVLALDETLDGELDLVVRGLAGVDVFLGNPQGIFQTTPVSTPIAPSFQLAARDFNGDAFPDLIVANGSAGLLSTYFADGLGGFILAGTTSVGGNPGPILASDFNGDGMGDVAFISNVPNYPFTHGSVDVFVGNGSGGFAFSWVFTNTTVACTGLVAADADHDGAVDLFAYFNGENLFKNNGNATFAVLPMGGLPFAVAVADVTGDGLPDVLGSAKCAALAIATGLLTFAPAQFYGAGSAVQALTAIDANADGRPDVVTANWESNDFSVLINQLGSVAGASLYGGGTPGCQGTESLMVNQAPAVNSPGFRITSTNAPRSSLGLLIVTDTRDGAGTDYFSIGILIHCGLFAATEILAFDIPSDTAGIGVAPAPIPNDSVLSGKSYFAQSIWSWTECVPSLYALSSSRGLHLTIQ